MKLRRRYRLVLWTALAPALLAAQVALAQRVRFTAPSNADLASAEWNPAPPSERGPLPDGGTWVARSSANSSGSSLASSGSFASSAPISALPSGSYASSNSVTPAASFIAAPPTSSGTFTTTSTVQPISLASTPVVGATPLPSPASAYGVSMSTPTSGPAGFDPYLVAARPAASFSGTITSPSGQFIVPQPMPRVPYYTQQPVAAANAQPYVVIPEPSCAAPVAQSAPLVYTAPTQPAPLMAAPPPTAAPIFAPPTVPILGPAPPPFAAPIYGTRWYVAADAIFLTRTNQLGNTPIVLLDNNTPTQSNVLLSTSDLDFKFQVGPRILLGYEMTPDSAFEASYFGIYNWKATATETGNNNLNLPGDLGLDLALDFFDADQASVTYKAIIHNAELNYVRTWGDISGLIGFRYFHLGEKLDITFTDVQNGSSSYDINTYNNLFGGQLGARLAHTCSAWSYDLTGKAGVFGNVISATQNVSDFSGFTARNTSVNTGQLAFIGDLAFNLNYQFSANWFLRGGYQVYWLEGLAEAPGQLDYTETSISGTTVHKTDSLFMHGANAGLMARW